MKTILVGITAILISAGAYAQTEQKHQNASDTVGYQKSNSQHPDGYMMVNGKMMYVKDNKMTLLKSDTTLTDGTIVMRNGNFIKSGGSRTMLREGQHMDLKGKIVYVSNDRENNWDENKTYGNASDTAAHQKSNSQHPDGYMVVNGKMMYVKDNQMTLLKNDTMLTNGTIVRRDGNFIKTGGSRTMLKEGQHMDLKGKIVYVSNNRDYKKVDENNRYGNASDTVANKRSNSQHPDGYMMVNGQMMCVKDNKMILLKNDTTLTDGTIVRRDGNFIKKGGTRTMLKEGQHMDLKGKIVYVSDNRDDKLDGKKKMYLVKDTTSNRNKQK